MKKVILSVLLLSASTLVFGFGNREAQDQNQQQGQAQGQAQGQLSVNKNSNRNHNSNYSSNKATGVGIGIAGASSGSQVTVQDNSVYHETDNLRIRNTPDAIPAALTTSNGTCMGSSTVSGSGPGIGVSVGTTYVSNPCNIRLDSIQMWNFGYKDIAFKIMCLRKDTVAKVAPELCGKSEKDNIVTFKPTSINLNKSVVANGFF